jgi:hypothetical protein
MLLYCPTRSLRNLFISRIVNVRHLEKVLQTLIHVIYANYELAKEHTYSLLSRNLSTGCK